MSAKTKEKVAKAIQKTHSKETCNSFKYPLRCWDIFAMFLHEERQNVCPIQKRIRRKLDEYK